MNIKKTFSLLLLLLTISACGSSGTSTAEKSCGILGLSPRVINGHSCDQPQGSAVVKLYSIYDIDPATIHPGCTGSMISSRHVLTAAHCFELPYSIVGTGIITGEGDNERHIPAVAVDMHPFYRYVEEVDRLFADIAIVTLQEEVNLPTLPLLVSREPQIGEVAYVYGYGARELKGEPSEADFTTLESGYMIIENVTADHIFVSFRHEDSTSVCYGDSGGPLVVINGRTPAIIGAVSMGREDHNCVTGDVVTYSRTQSPEVLDWITQTFPEINLD